MLVRYLPREAALTRALVGEIVDWDTADHLLATIIELLAGANWQRGGGKGAKPKPLVRPGMRDEKTTKFGGTTLPLDEARRRLDRLHRRHRCRHCRRMCGNAGALANHERSHMT